MCARNNGFLPKNCESAAERCKSLATESTDPLADYCSAQPLLVERRSKTVLDLYRPQPARRAHFMADLLLFLLNGNPSL